jgi:hypothetical protein
MQRILNTCRIITIEPFDTGYTRRFRPTGSYSPVLGENELVVGSYDSKNYLFIHRAGVLYSVSHDDFSFDYISREIAALNTAFTGITIPSSYTGSMPDDDGVI